MKDHLIISRCESVIGYVSRFNMKAMVGLDYVRSCQLTFGEESQITAGEDYVLWVKVKETKDGVLHGKIIKAKSLKDCLES